MALTQHLGMVREQAEQARALVAAAVAPRWKGTAAAAFGREREDLVRALVMLREQVLAAMAVTAEYERMWWQERAEREALARESSAQGSLVGGAG